MTKALTHREISSRGGSADTDAQKKARQANGATSRGVVGAGRVMDALRLIRALPEYQDDPAKLWAAIGRIDALVTRILTDSKNPNVKKDIESLK